MKFLKLNSRFYEDVRISDYQIDWERAVSRPQKAVKDFLFPYWKNKVICEEFLIPGSKLRIDLLNIHSDPMIAIEVSPEATHRRYNSHFHRGNKMNFVATIKRDEQKRLWCERNEIAFVELYDDDIQNLSKNLFLEKFKVNI